MFKEMPEVANMFNMSHQQEINGEKAHQPATLAWAVHACW
jgi:hemoglobin-like flavoprotein